MQCDHLALGARTAITVLVALILTLAPAGTAPAADSSARVDEMLIPSAGWHGRPIRDPHRHNVIRTATGERPVAGWSAGPVSLGAGFSRADGSARVREVQRRLTRLGYRVGPVDGLFGPRTRASVAWFQVKHGLKVSGRATLDTVRHLRVRSGAPDRGSLAPSEPAAAADGEAPSSRSTVWEAFNQLVGPRQPVPDGRSASERSSFGSTLLLALVVADVVLLLALLVQRRSRATAGAPAQPAAMTPTPDPAHPGEEPRATRRFPPSAPAEGERPPDHVAVGTRADENGAQP